MKKLISILICLLSAISCNAKIITVDDDGPADFNNIQAAINDANDGDIVEVQPGIYTGNGNRDIDFLGKAITVRSIDPNDLDVVAATIINCQGSIIVPHRGFYFHSNEGNNSIIEGLTITNGIRRKGWSNYGGGIYCKYSSPTIRKNIITNNHIFKDGEIQGFGGGIRCYYSSAVITDNVITHNSVEGTGGGISACLSSLILNNNIITSNDAYHHGGFMPGPARGGGISCSSSSLTIANNTISGNQAHDFNEPHYFDPGIGGGIEGSSSSLTIINTIIWGNTPNEIDCSDEIISSYSDIRGNWPGIGNFDADPCFADPCSGDYYLKSTAGRWDPNSQTWITDSVTSPCIDAGNPGCPLGNEPSDANNVRINMGAYGGTAEASKTPNNWRSIADLTNDWAVDINDLGVFVSYWLDNGDCIPSNLNRSQFVDFADYAIFANNWLWQ